MAASALAASSCSKAQKGKEMWNCFWQLKKVKRQRVLLDAASMSQGSLERGL